MRLKLARHLNRIRIQNTKLIIPSTMTEPADTDPTEVPEARDQFVYSRTADYDRFIGIGLHEEVAESLDNVLSEFVYEGIYKKSDQKLDQKVLIRLRELDTIGALHVIGEFGESDLSTVTNKSLFLLAAVKAYKQRDKQADDVQIKKLLERTGYNLDVSTGQRIYGRPPPNWEGPPPGDGCELFMSHIPKDSFEDVFVPILEPFGTIYDLRLMLDRSTAMNRGFAFVTFTTKESAQECIKQLNGKDLKPGWPLKCTPLVAKSQLIIAPIPKDKTEDDVQEQLDKFAAGVTKITVEPSPSDPALNRGYVYVAFEHHKQANDARKALTRDGVTLWGVVPKIAEWADSEWQSNDACQATVKSVIIYHVPQGTTQEELRTEFAEFGKIEKFTKNSNGNWQVHFQCRDAALKAIAAKDNYSFKGASLGLHLGKPIVKPYRRRGKPQDRFRNRDMRYNDRGDQWRERGGRFDNRDFNDRFPPGYGRPMGPGYGPVMRGMQNDGLLGPCPMSGQMGGPLVGQQGGYRGMNDLFNRMRGMFGGMGPRPNDPGCNGSSRRGGMGGGRRGMGDSHDNNPHGQYGGKRKFDGASDGNGGKRGSDRQWQDY